MIKVIAHLNAVNENYAAQKQRIIEKEVNDVKELEFTKQMLLQEEIRQLQDLIASSEIREKEANEQLTSFKREAQAKEEELRRNHEMQRLSHSETVRRMSLTFEEESRRCQENALYTRNELADGYKQRTEKLREDINSSHSEEIQLLKARHEKNILRVEQEAKEQAKLALENAVAMTRLEYENKLAQQLISHTEVCCETSVEVKALEEELAIVKVQASEVKSLKDKLTERIASESKLQLELISVKKILDHALSNHQKVVAELQANIAELRADLQTTKDSLQNLLDQYRSLLLDVRHFTLIASLLSPFANNRYPYPPTTEQQLENSY